MEDKVIVRYNNQLDIHLKGIERELTSMREATTYEDYRKAYKRMVEDVQNFDRTMRMKFSFIDYIDQLLKEGDMGV